MIKYLLAQQQISARRQVSAENYLQTTGSIFSPHTPVSPIIMLQGEEMPLTHQISLHPHPSIWLITVSTDRFHWEVREICGCYGVAVNQTLGDILQDQDEGRCVYLYRLICAYTIHTSAHILVPASNHVAECVHFHACPAVSAQMFHFVSLCAVDCFYDCSDIKAICQSDTSLLKDSSFQSATGNAS